MRLWGISGPFQVRTVKKFIHTKRRDLIGHHDWASRTLEVHQSLKGYARQNVLWHEWVHGVLADGGVRLKDKHAERVCDILAAALTGAGVSLPIVK